MSHEWMIDVLMDLKKFAQQNGLMGLAEQLDDSLLVAAAELKQAGPELVVTNGYAKQNGDVRGTFARGNEC
jgi:hypothetical protein